MDFPTLIPLRKICRTFGAVYQEAKLIRANANFVFDCGDKFLRLSDARTRPVDAIEREVKWIRALANAGFEVVQVLPSQSGRFWEVVAATDASFEWIVVCTERIDGTKMTKEEWHRDHFFRLGQLAGRLHEFSLNEGRPLEVSALHWNEIPACENFKFLPDDDSGLFELYHQVLAQINHFPVTTGNYGLVHYDIHHGNYFLLPDKRISLLDFELMCKTWLANDIAIILYYACQVGGQAPDPDFAEYFLDVFSKGYQTGGDVRNIDTQLIRHFLLYRDLFVLGHLGKIWQQKTLRNHEKKYREMVFTSIQTRRKELGY